MAFLPALDASVSVIIPVLNESACIAQCIAAILKDPAVAEIIVVDGGSFDSTPDIALSAGARVLIHRAPIDNGGGRGGQILAGIRETRFDIVAIVHADALPEPDAFSGIRKALINEPAVIGGAAGCRFDVGGVRFRILERLNDLRTILTSITFGDQIQFFRREAVVGNNIFPRIPLMEDVEFSLRLRRYGKTIYLRQHNRASARRWEIHTWWKSLHVFWFLTEYLARRYWRGQPDVVAMYHRYYGAARYRRATSPQGNMGKDMGEKIGTRRS